MLKLILLILVASPVFAVNAKSISYDTSLKYLLKNISPEGTKKGVVVASPSRSNPNYFYHWVRDAALVMSTIYDIYDREKNPQLKQKLETALYNFVEMVKNNQAQSGFNDLGEPKYNVDGTPYTGPWGRPQNDGPALRAITLIKFANSLIDQGKIDWVKQNLYSPSLPANTPIKMDLEFVAQRFKHIGFDYWEEIRGLHFSTAMGQRKALLMGANLAQKLGDTHAANWYFLQAKKVEQLLARFWNPHKGFIEATIDQQGGFWKSQLDISSILGIHHGSYGNFYQVTDSRVIKTAQAIEDSFNSLYQINRYKGDLGTAIGRYPEDTYDGYRTDRQGHAWFLATFAMAEYHLRLKKALEAKFNNNKIWNIELLSELTGVHVHSEQQQNLISIKHKILKKLEEKANRFFERADFHSGDNGHMSEQMNRYTGYMEGATDLTWSYASHLSALLWR
jgi:glucoamylase